MENISITATSGAADEKLLKIARTIDDFKGGAPNRAERVASLADALGVRFRLAAGDRSAIRSAALLRDIGEQTMNRDYIKSNRALTVAERFDVERHPVVGEREAARRGLDRAVQLLIRWHHEWWNGAGYPDAVSREEIPLAARILRAADTFAALTESRAYRAALSADEAKQYLIENAAVEFDPKVVKAFLSLDEALIGVGGKREF